MPRGFLNIYRSGRWHQPGKPGAYDRHGGDIYADYDDALQAIDPPSHYVATIPVEWVDAETHPRVNPGEPAPFKFGVDLAPMPESSGYIVEEN